MRMITLMLVCAMASGCSSITGDKSPEMPNQTLILEESMYAMSRHETIDAIKECETSGLRAIPIWGKRKVNGVPSAIVVDVTCGPKWSMR